MLDIVTSYHYMQFQGKRIIQTQQNSKTPHFRPNFDPLGPNFCRQILFKSLASSVIRYHAQLLLCKISEKRNDPVLRKFSGGRTDGRGTDGREWFQWLHCRTDFKRPTVCYETWKQNWHPSSILQTLINLTKIIIKSLSAYKKLVQFFNPSLRYSQF